MRPECIDWHIKMRRDTAERYGKELKPCPIGTKCNDDYLDMIVGRADRVEPDMYRGHVTCQDCGLRGPETIAQGRAETIDLIAYEWNLRESEY